MEGPATYTTVFKITPGGALTLIHSFCDEGVCPYGAEPAAGRIQAADGDFYGTTEIGGATVVGRFSKSPQPARCRPYTVSARKAAARTAAARPTPAGALTTLHTLDNTDGGEPDGALVQAIDGDLYGTTSSGGANGQGTVFRITPSGKLSTLRSFCAQAGCRDGEYASQGLAQATDGNFYGTTFAGGKGYGTIFRITPGGVLTRLYVFCPQSGCPDGLGPWTPLVQGTCSRLLPGFGLRDRLQVVRWARPVCGNAAHLRQGGSGRQNSGDGSSGRR